VIYVGTSGWQYRDWAGRFYPKGLPQRQWLRFFSERLATVEVNNSFYRLPEETTFDRWREEAAGSFLFAVKVSRYLTHLKRLRDPKDPVELFVSRARRLGPSLGPLLVQLPPNLPSDLDRLADLLEVLPDDLRWAFEFRHDSWKDPEVHKLLDGKRCAWVIADRPGRRFDPVVTGGWSYIRFHQGGRTRPEYPRRKLRTWAERIDELDADDVYVYFNNDTGGAAPRDAATLTELLASRDLDVRGART
jgi:uncharacterized protein YecE (DUF72 family)